MSIPAEKIYPRTGDKQTVYLKSVVTNPAISVGEYTMYNDFVNDPVDFEKNNVLYHYPINHDKLFVGKFCSIACGAKFMFTSANHTLDSFINVSVSPVFLGMEPPNHRGCNRMGQQGGYCNWKRCLDWV